MPDIDFDTAFKHLTGNTPFPWQRALYHRFLEDRPDNIPSSCSLPTGLGKTAVLAVWLIALAHNPTAVPRRLVYVVNRRTVVDQTTIEAENLRRNAAAAGVPTPAISTLRGQFADNRQWSADPSRPAIIAGTVDMIGSRLLFSGYGVGFKSRPLHAGFLGQDALLVHDEAHLEPAFQELIVNIQREQHERERTETLPWPKLRVMELTATSRGGGAVFALSDADRAEAEVQKRINAKKAIHLHENKDEKKLADEVADLALKHKDSGRAVLVFVRRVDDVDKVVKKLPKGSFEQLTGTLRGKERDELVETPVFRRFLPQAGPGEGTVYLVCTSAGEVGVNLSADHLVCDLSTFDSMAQRFGRVNRFGDRTDTRIDVVYPKTFDETDDHESRLKKTLDLLQQLQGDGSPEALGRLDPDARLAAFAPQPTVLPTTDVLFDAWALTTVRGKLPGRPPVEPYLHGLTTDLPETHVAWREEVGVVTGDLRDTFDPEDLLEAYPLKPHELLRDNSGRVFDRLRKLAADAGTPVWLVSDDGTVEVTTLGDAIDAGKESLSYKTVLLPPSAGGLENGMLDGGSKSADDVADEWTDEKGNPRRVRVWDDDEQFDDKTKDMRPVRRIDLPAGDEDEEGRFWHWFERPTSGDTDGSKANTKPVLWQVHTDDVTTNANEIIKNLPLPNDLRGSDTTGLTTCCHEPGC